MARRKGSRLYGAIQMRKILRAAPDEIKKHVLDVMELNGKAIENAARSNIDDKSGTLSRTLRTKVEKSGFRVKVGIIGKRAARVAFYARFLEFGTPSGIYRNGKAKGKRRRPVQARPWLYPAFNRRKKVMAKQINKTINFAMRVVAKRNK